MDSSKKVNKLKSKPASLYYVHITNRYVSLPAFSAPPDLTTPTDPILDHILLKHQILLFED